MSALSQLTKVAPLARAMSTVSGPPTVKISLAEKLVHGVAISVGMLAIPAWVLVNIKNYRSHS